MAVYRQVQIMFWQDPFVLELSSEEKYFYLYLLTNSKTTQCGIYEISETVIHFETGLGKNKIKELLNKFVEYKKIEYDQNAKEIFILNWLKFNPIDNTNIEKCVLKELKVVKSEKSKLTFLVKCLELKFNIPLLQNAYEGLIRGNVEPNNLETPPYKKEEEEEEEEKEETKEKEEEKANTPDETSEPRIPFKEIVDNFNKICKSLPNVKTISNKRKRAIKNRWSKSKGINSFITLFTKADTSDFLSGRNEKWQGCSFDWLINEANMIKVIEGNYDNKASKNNGKTGSFTDFPQRDYDYDALEKNLLGRHEDE